MALQQTVPSFPNHFINPQEKGEDWMYQMVSAIWGEWGTHSINSFEKGSTRYSLNKLYALGKQPNDIYKPMFEIAEDENSSYINLDYSPLPIIPKFKRITNNRFAKIDFTVTAEAIDPYALDEKSDYEAEERANIQVRRLLQDLGLPADTLKTGELDQPHDEEELAIKMEFGYKHNQAIDIEKRIDAVFTHEKIKERLGIARDNGFDTGVYTLKVSTNPETGKIEIRNVDPSHMIVSPTSDPYFRDIWYAGETILMTVDKVRSEAEASGVHINEDMLEEVAKQNTGHNGNPSSFTSSLGFAFPYDSCKVPVFDIEFLSCNSFWYEKRWDKATGRPILGKVKKPGNRSDREYYNDKRTVVYRAKWIPGTRILFDYGLKSDVAVKRERNEWESLLSYKIIAPEMNRMETSPIIENLIPIVDAICIAWYKLQNVIARARPKGIMIEVGALEQVNLGDGGEESVAMRPIDILDMFNQTGMLVYRRISFDGQASNYKPIEELNNGLGTEAVEHFAVIDAYMQKIRDMIGFNDITDGSTPDPKTLNGVASMAAEATNNALHQLYDAEQKLIEMVAEDVAIRVHDSIAYKEDSPYQYVVAPDTVKSIRENRDRIHRQFSIAIEYGSDKFEKERLQAHIDRALEAQQVNLADVIAVERCRNTKQAEQILAYRIKKNMERLAKQKQQEFMDNAKANMQAAQMAEEEKRKTIAMEQEGKMSEIAAKRDAEIDVLVVKYQLEKDVVHDPNRSTQIEAENIKAEALKESAKIKKQQTTQISI